MGPFSQVMFEDRGAAKGRDAVVTKRGCNWGHGLSAVSCHLKFRVSWDLNENPICLSMDHCTLHGQWSMAYLTSIPCNLECWKTHVGWGKREGHSFYASGNFCHVFSWKKNMWKLKFSKTLRLLSSTYYPALALEESHGVCTLVIQTFSLSHRELDILSQRRICQASLKVSSWSFYYILLYIDIN